MARTAGDGADVKKLADQLKMNLKEIIDLNKKGQTLLNTLAETSKDKSYETAESIVNEVASILLQSLPDCGETASKVNAYGEFLESIENG